MCKDFISNNNNNNNNNNNKMPQSSDGEETLVFSLPQKQKEQQQQEQLLETKNNDEQEKVKKDKAKKEQEEQQEQPEEIVYGQLLILGYASASAKYHNIRNVSLTLKRRPIGNGIQRISEAPSLSNTLHSQLQSRTHTHTITFRKQSNDPTLQNEEAFYHTAFEYDPETDLFQAGRFGEGNDLVISGELVDGGSCVSRFAFRIECSRHPPYTCRLFAGGFDNTRHLFVGDVAPRWNEPLPDAFTTNGVLMWLPSEKNWTEVTVVHGSCFGLRSNWSTCGEHRENWDNILTDGCLIHNGGVTLLFRSPEAMARDVDYSRSQFEATLEQMNTREIVCPVALEPVHFCPTIVPGLPRDQESDTSWVFTTCGHVFSQQPRLFSRAGTRCPLCRTSGNYTPLLLSYQPAITRGYTHVFHPCGHAIDEDNAEKWRTLGIPPCTNPYKTLDWTKGGEDGNHICPFCGGTLSFVCGSPYKKLFFSEASIYEDDNEDIDTKDNVDKKEEKKYPSLLS